MNKLSVTSLNTRGFGNLKKRRDVLDKIWFNQFTKIDILFLQETHSAPQDEISWKKQFQTSYLYFSHDTTSAGGLLIAIKQHLPFVLSHLIVHQHYILLHCTIADEDYVFVNVHNRIPISKRYRYKITQWLDNIWENVQNYPTPRILLGGDFNLCIDDDGSVLSKIPASKILREFISETEMIDCWRLLNPDSVRYTRHGIARNKQHTGSCIDYLFVSPLLVNYLDTADIGLAYQSDHSPVNISFLMNRNPKGKGLFRFPDFLVEDDKFAEMLINMIEEILRLSHEQVPEEHRPSPSLLWDTVKAAIRGRTIEYLSQGSRKRRNYRSLALEVNELQVIIDEWIANDGPLDDILQELSTKHEQLDSAYTALNKRKKQLNIKRSQIFSNTCSKYFFCKVKGIPGSLRHLFSNEDVLVSTDNEILEVCREFYDNLYTPLNAPACKLSNYSTPPEGCYLTDEERTMLSSEITKEDLQFALKSMKLGKSPGVDGLTVAFYRQFWPVIGDLVFNSIMHAQKEGHFTIEQRRGIIKLLPKPRRDPRYIKNIRPITLLNVDYKLFTKVLGDRVKNVLPSLIHTDQNGFVQNRYLGNNVLDVYSLVALAEDSHDDNFTLLSLDIEKAFDSVNWDFIRATLWAFGFPEEFIDWVFLTQQDAYVNILNNGHISERIKLNRGLAQGCCLSPFLFILAIEGLASTIRADERIPGIAAAYDTKKVALVADDSLLSFIGSTTVIQRVKTILDHFSLVSGLKLNYDKSTLIALGPRVPSWFEDDCVSEFRKVHISEGFTYLGLMVSNDRNQMVTANFGVDPNIVDTIMDSRSPRHTSLSGRILQINQLVVSTFVYRFQLLPSPPLPQFTQITRSCFEYIWDHGRHRLNRNIMYQSKKTGGFGLVNVMAKNQSLKFAWFNRLLSESVNFQFWAIHLYHCFIMPIQDVLNCNLQPSSLHLLCKSHLPWFWTDVFTLWFKTFFVTRKCITEADKRRVPILSIMFNSAVTLDATCYSMEMYNFLAENNLLLMKDFVSNYDHIFQIVSVFDSQLPKKLCKLKNGISDNWLAILTEQLNQDNYISPCRVSDRLVAGLLPPKAFMEMLIPKVDESSILSKWETDLECTIEDFLWTKICKKANLMFDSYLRDFIFNFYKELFITIKKSPLIGLHNPLYVLSVISMMKLIYTCFGNVFT